MRAPVPGSHAGACLRPALTSWRETLRLLKKMHGFARFLRYKTLFFSSVYRYTDYKNSFFARFCAEKRYYSSAYINVGIRVIVFLRRTSQNACI